MDAIYITWDTAVLVLLFIIFGYGFILGQNQTVKLLLCLYISILVADGLASLVQTFIISPSPGFAMLWAGYEEIIVKIVRLLFFITGFFLFTIKSGFHVRLEKHTHSGTQIGIHAVFSLCVAILFLSTVFIYFAGNSFVEGLAYEYTAAFYERSLVVQILVKYYEIWFSFPAIFFLIVSHFLSPEK